MKKIIYIGLMLATIGFTASSCKKEETPEPQATLPTNNNNGNNNNNNNNDTATLSLVKTMKVIDGNTQIFFYTFTYDSQGRMSQIVYENTTSSVIKTTNLTWKPDSLLVERIEGTTPPTYSQYTLTRNANGYITTVTGGPYNITNNYTYDADNHLTEKSGAVSYAKFFWSSNNVDSIITLQGTTNANYKYDYSDKTESRDFGFKYCPTLIEDLSFITNQSPDVWYQNNLLYKTYIGNVTFPLVTATYEFDANNRVTKLKSNNQSVAEYTYY